MEYFLLLILVASAFGIPQSEENSDSVEDHLGNSESWELERKSGSFEELALSAEPKEWMMEALNTTNRFRRLAGLNLSPLTLDPNLTSSAQKWAESLSNSCAEEYEKTPTDFIDESIEVKEMLSPNAVGVERIVNGWYAQHHFYDCRELLAKDKDLDDEYYFSVKDYMNMMGRDKFSVGYGLASCHGKILTKVFVARYSTPSDVLLRMHADSLVAQKEKDPAELNIAAFIPCPVRDFVA